MSKRRVLHGISEREAHAFLESCVRQDEHHIRGKRLGRHIEHDMRSRQYAIKVEVEDLTALKSVLWKRECGSFDQGNLGSCTGNAMAGVLMTDPLWKSGTNLTETDALALYELATKLDNIAGTYPPDDTGSSGLAVMKAAKQMGFIDGYRHAFTVTAMLKALQTVPLITGTGWYDSFDSPDGNGVVSIQPGAVVRGGHEYEINGVTLEFQSNGQIDEENSLLDLWNSWGTEFGLGGAFKMSLKTYRQLLREYGDATVPIPKTEKADSEEPETSPNLEE